MTSTSETTTVRESERLLYNSFANDWYRANCHLRTLRLFAPLRAAYLKECLIKAETRPSAARTENLGGLEGYKILDIGCGGGFLSEELASRGAEVLAVDISDGTIQANKQRQSELRGALDRIDYRCGNAETLARAHIEEKAAEESWWPARPSFVPQKGFDVIVASEVLEHVDHPRLFLWSLDALLRPGGLLFVTTPNRTWLSRLVTITMAENWLKLVPKGTHDWRRYVRVNELTRYLRKQALPPIRWWRSLASPLADGSTPQPEGQYKRVAATGSIFVPFVERWFRIPSKSILYMAAYRKESFSNQ